MAKENRVDKNNMTEEEVREQDPKNKKEKQKKHTGRNVAIGVIAALLLSTGGYYGLGPGQGDLPFIGGNNESSVPGIEQTQNQNDSQQSEAGDSSIVEHMIGDESGNGNSKEDSNAAEDGVFLITVSQDKIIVDGREMDEKTLEDYLSDTFVTGENAQENMTTLSIKVKDDKAIKSTYDAVTALLAKLDLSYTEE